MLHYLSNIPSPLDKVTLNEIGIFAEIRICISRQNIFFNFCQISVLKVVLLLRRIKLKVFFLFPLNLQSMKVSGRKIELKCVDIDVSRIETGFSGGF